MTQQHEQLKELSSKMQKILEEELDSCSDNTDKYLLTDLSDKLFQLTEEIDYFYNLT